MTHDPLNSDAGRYRLGYRADIEGLRAVAILLVVAAHAGVPWLAGGYVGVDVFFVLSGYLITGLLIREFSLTGRLCLVDFYARRLRRLLPALIVMIAVVGALSAALMAPLEQTRQAETARAASLWLSNFHFALLKLEYFGSEVSSNLFLHTWSLGVEEQFYLVWPPLLLFLLGAWKWQGGGSDFRRLRSGLIVTVVLCLALCVFLSHTLAAWGFYLMPSRAWQFAIGALAVLWSGAAPGRIDTAGSLRVAPWVGAVAGWLGLGMILVAALLFDQSTPYPGAHATVPSIGAALVLLSASSAGARGPQRLLSLAPMQAIGRVSYAWYLWHWPVLLLGAAVLVADAPGSRLLLVLLSLGLAVLSYVTVERPLRRNAFLAGRPLGSVAAGVGAMAVCSVAAGAWMQATGLWAGSPSQLRYAEIRKDRPVLYSMGCDEWFFSARAVACGFGQAEATHTAVLIGDSIGLQWFPAVASLYDKPGWRIVVLTKSSCPMVDEPYVYGRIGRRYVECERWRTDALGSLAALKPDVVFMGSGLSYPFDESEWVEGTRRVLEPMARAAGEVFIIRATHALGFDGPGCLSGRDWRSYLPVAPADCSAPAGTPADSDVLAWLSQAAAAYRNVSVLDLNPLVCGNGRCDAERDGQIVYRDGSHLAASFVASLAGGVAESIEAVRAGGVAVLKPVPPPIGG